MEIHDVVLIILVPLSFFTGWMFVKALTIHPEKMFRSVFVFSFLLSFCLFLFLLSFHYGKLLLAVIPGITLFIAGYLTHAKVYLSKRHSRKIPEVDQNVIRKERHRAVVYYTHGEPETYNPSGWLDQFREFDDQNIRFVPFIARPFFIHGLRKQYLKAGKSNHRQGHLRMLSSLELAYRQQGDLTTRFYISFLDDEPGPDAAVIQALNDGASAIIVATVFLTVSNHTAEGKNMVNNLESEKKYGVPVRFTEPLWNSGTLMQAFMEKVNSNMGKCSKEKVAIALIGYGQPAEWDKEFPTMTEQDSLFRDGIIELLCREGFSRDNLGKAWMEFKEPKPYALMEKFVSNRVEKIFYFASAISADAIFSQVFIPELVNKYPFPEGVEVINLGAWNAHPLVIQAIKERIDIEFSTFTGGVN